MISLLPVDKPGDLLLGCVKVLVRHNLQVRVHLGRQQDQQTCPSSQGLNNIIKRLSLYLSIYLHFICIYI